MNLPRALKYASDLSDFAFPQITVFAPPTLIPAAAFLSVIPRASLIESLIASSSVS